MAISDTKKLGVIIRNARKAQKLTQEQLAAQSGVGVRFLRELENGKPSCHVGKVLDVLAMLGLMLHVVSRDGAKTNLIFDAEQGDL